jgi:hypothetical protein
MRAELREPLRVFIGYDPRQPIAFQVLAHSIASLASLPVAITRLQLNQLPIKRTGLTEFTYSRYVVPYLCNYEGEALFLDADMLCLADIYELLWMCHNRLDSVSVVKNPKLRFEWPSLMFFNNAHCKKLTLEYIETGTPQSFDWANGVGEIPAEFNHLIGYDAPRTDAKIVHYTQGIPCFAETSGTEYEAEWMAELKACNSTVSWQEIMGRSVHAKPVLERLARKVA